MDQQLKDRLDGLEDKLDQLITRLDAAERTLGAFLNGPGKSIGRVFGIRG